MSSDEGSRTSPPIASIAESSTFAHPSVQQQMSPVQQSTPVEMSQLNSTSNDPASPSRVFSASSAAIRTPAPLQTIPIQQPLSFDGATTLFTTPLSPAILPDQIVSTSNRDRSESSAIGPSSDGPVVALDTSAASGPAVQITLLLISGARHPYTIDQKYLWRRKVVAAEEEVDPYTISVHTMKELIWRDWREEWDPRPTTPNSIRLIHFGKLLDDKSTLRDCRFQEGQSNVVHMTVKPQDIVDDEENAKSGKVVLGRERAGSESGAGCRCCIVQ